MGNPVFMDPGNEKPSFHSQDGLEGGIWEWKTRFPLILGMTELHLCEKVLDNLDRSC